MKKNLLFILLLIYPFISYAQDWKFKWNKSLEGSLGYSRMYKTFGDDSYGNTPPKDLLAIDCTFWGLYVGMDFWTKKTGHNVYGYDETISTWAVKLGPSFRLWNEYKNTKVVFTPHFGWAWYTVNDTSNNSIGQRQDYGLRESMFLFGGKITFAYKSFEIGAFGSNVDFGLTIGANIDY